MSDSVSSSTSVSLSAKQESGPKAEEPSVLINQYKDIYNTCLHHLQECCDQRTRDALAPLLQMLDHLWTLNDLLFKTVDDLESEAGKQMRKLHRRLGQEKAMQQMGVGGDIKNDVSKYVADVKSLIMIIELLSRSKRVDLEAIEFKIVNKQDVADALGKRSSNMNSAEMDRTSSKQSEDRSESDRNEKQSIDTVQSAGKQSKESVQERRTNDEKQIIPEVNVSERIFQPNASERISQPNASERISQVDASGRMLQGNVSERPHQQESDRNCDCMNFVPEPCPCADGWNADPAMQDSSISRSSISNYRSTPPTPIGPSCTIIYRGRRESQTEEDVDDLLRPPGSPRNFKPCECNELTPELVGARSEVARLEAELAERTNELSAAQEVLKTKEASFQETKWALAAEVAEKHDQVSELRKTIATLEETLRQADMQTHFKDDIIKKMRMELKGAKTMQTESRKLYDVVTEVQQNRRMEEGWSESGLYSSSSDGGPTPRERVAQLRQSLKVDMKQIEEEEMKAKQLNEPDLGLDLTEDTRNSLLEIVESLEELVSSPEALEGGVLAQIKARLTNFTMPLKGIALKGGGDGGNEIGTDSFVIPSILHGRTQKATRALRGMQESLDSIISSVKQNIELSDSIECNGKLKNFLSDFRLVENCILDIAQWARIPDNLDSPASNEKSSCRDHDCEECSSREKAVTALLEEKEAALKNVKKELEAIKVKSSELEEEKESLSVGSFISHIDGILQKLVANHLPVQQTTLVTADTLKERLSLLDDTLFNVCIPELKAEIEAEQKLVFNKDESLKNLHSMVELRQKQVESFTAKVEELERQLEQQRTVIAELQQAVQECKRLELKAKDREICSLQFEICELDVKQRRVEEEFLKKEEELHELHEDNLCLTRKLLSLDEDLRTVSIENEEWQTRVQKYYKISSDLEKDLQQRDMEIKGLQNKIRRLEEDAEVEVDRNEGRLIHDAKVISALKMQVNQLQDQLRSVRSEYSKVLVETEAKYLSEKAHSADTMRKLIMQNQGFTNKIHELTIENKSLNEQALQFEGCTRSLVEERNKVQKDCETKLQELRNKIEEKKLLFDEESRKWEEKTRLLENTVRKVNNMVLEGRKVQQDLQNKLKMYEVENNTLQASNADLKRHLAQKQEELNVAHTSELTQLNELEMAVRRQRSENMALSTRCSSLSADLEKEATARKQTEDENDKLKRVIKTLKCQCEEWTQRFDEVCLSEMELRKALHVLKEQGLKKLQEESDARVAAEEEVAALKKELERNNKIKSVYEELKTSHMKLLKTIQSSEKMKTNLEKLLTKAEEDKRRIEEERDAVESELAEVKEDKLLLQDKIASISKAKEREVRSLQAENQRITEKSRRLNERMEETYPKIREYELNIIPSLNTELLNRERIIEALKTEVHEANASCMRMRQEALNLIESTEAHLSSTKLGAGDARLREEQRQAVTAMSQSVYNDIYRKKNHCQGAIDPWGPVPPSAHNVWSRHTQHTRINDSGDCLNESGFQSLMTSPEQMESDRSSYGPERDSDQLMT